MKLEIRDLTFSYDGKRNILDGISTSFESGEFTVVLGRNGAGKTTLFKNLLGLLKPQKGEVLCDGLSFSDMSVREKARKIAYIPQESNPAFSYSVLTSVLMGTTSMISSLSSPKEKEIRKAYEALEKFHIADLAGRKTNTLSGGERQLVLCARAVAQEAGILLFDEPTSNLDWANQIKTLGNIRALTRDGYTAIVSTHNLEQALNFATRLILIKDGKLCYDASPAELASSSLLSSFYDIDISVEEYKGHYICIPKESE